MAKWVVSRLTCWLVGHEAVITKTADCRCTRCGAEFLLTKRYTVYFKEGGVTCLQ